MLLASTADWAAAASAGTAAVAACEVRPRARPLCIRNTLYHRSPMRFRRKILDDIAAQITRLGLQRCAVCGSDSSMQASPYPVLLSIGGFHHERADPRWDPEANVRFMIEVRCEVCGHVMLFDSEKFHGPNEPVLVTGPPEVEEQLESEEED